MRLGRYLTLPRVGALLALGIGVLAAPRPAAAQTVVNNSFEVPFVGPGAFSYTPVAPGWTFDAGSGISGNGSAFTSGNPPAPSGSQVAFIQSTGSIQQAITGTQGGNNYRVSFFVAQRANVPGPQTLRVLADGNLVGTVAAGTTSYKQVSFAFIAPSSNFTLRIEGANPGDNTAFVDLVTAEFIPEPGALQLAFGGVLPLVGLAGAGRFRRLKRSG